MNARQMAQQIRYVLSTETWPESPNDLVFGDRLSFVLTGLPDEKELPGAFPFVLVSAGPGTADPDDPNLMEQTFDVLAVASVSGGRMGEKSLIGGPKSALGSSANRGVMELNDRVRAALQKLSAIDGAGLQLHTSSVGKPQSIGGGRALAYGETTLSGWVTAEPSYSSPTRLAVAGSTWTWTGAQCSARYDFIQYRLGYVDGSAPAETPGDLDAIIYTGTDLTTVVAQIAGKAYSVFADYGIRGSAIEGSSDGRELSAFLTT